MERLPLRIDYLLAAHSSAPCCDALPPYPPCGVATVGANALTCVRNYCKRNYQNIGTLVQINGNYQGTSFFTLVRSVRLKTAEDSLLGPNQRRLICFSLF